MCGLYHVHVVKSEVFPRILFPVRLAGRSKRSGSRGRRSSWSDAVTDRHGDACGLGSTCLLPSALHPALLLTANRAGQRQPRCPPVPVVATARRPSSPKRPLLATFHRGG